MPAHNRLLQRIAGDVADQASGTHVSGGLRRSRLLNALLYRAVQHAVEQTSTPGMGSARQAQRQGCGQRHHFEFTHGYFFHKNADQKQRPRAAPMPVGRVQLINKKTSPPGPRTRRTLSLKLYQGANINTRRPICHAKTRTFSTASRICIMHATRRTKALQTRLRAKTDQSPRKNSSASARLATPTTSMPAILPFGRFAFGHKAWLKPSLAASFNRS